MSKNVFDISQELMSNAYPGRGIILGRTPDNKKKCYRLLHHGPLGEQPQPRVHRNRGRYPHRGI